MDNFDADALYGAIGERIRKTREGLPIRLSQAALAKKLNISRASIVNIEAGRQHAPLHLLWKLAKEIDVELTSLIPTRADLASIPANVELSDEMLKELRKHTNGNQALESTLSSFIAQAVVQLSGRSVDANRAQRRKNP